MPAEAIVTLVLATLIIAAAALGLIRVIGHLMATLKTLRALTGGVEVVAEKTSTVPAVVRREIWLPSGSVKQRCPSGADTRPGCTRVAAR